MNWYALRGEYLQPVGFKKLFEGFYVRESYSLFMRLAGDLIVENGSLVFITPDTFINSNLHKGLRKYLFENFTVSHLITFPSSFFPGVDYGYGKMCITAATRKTPDSEHCVRLVQITESDGVLALSAGPDFANSRTILLENDKILRDIEVGILCASSVVNGAAAKPA